MSASSVMTGLDVLVRQGFAPLRGRRVGLVTHPAAVDSQLRHAIDLFSQAPDVKLEALFGPEHGLLGQAQDLVGVESQNETSTGIRIVSLYGDSEASLKPTRDQLRGLDALVIDLQDVGSRYYTFQATMLLCIQAAFEAGIPAWVLDRPNPIGGVLVEGPTIQPEYGSFIGIHPIAIRHGMTIGELARLYYSELQLHGELHVVPCEGLRRHMSFDQAGVPWVMPSPNMPTVETAFVYPGQCLLEGTNISEGRGTTRPLELCGVPNIDARRLADRLNGERWAGVIFRPVWFEPTFHKFAGLLCGGVQLHVTDRTVFQPVRVGLATLIALREAAGPAFDWRREPAYEFVADRLAVDLLFGSTRERLAIEAGESASSIASRWEPEETAFRQRRAPFLLYQ